MFVIVVWLVNCGLIEGSQASLGPGQAEVPREDVPSVSDAPMTAERTEVSKLRCSTPLIDPIEF